MFEVQILKTFVLGRLGRFVHLVNIGLLGLCFYATGRGVILQACGKPLPYLGILIERAGYINPVMTAIRPRCAG